MIDAHTHFYPSHISENPESWAQSRGETYWGMLVGKRPDGKRSLQGFPSEKKFLDDMDAAGVERAIIQGWYWENPQTCEELNAEISKIIKRYPDRLSAFASANPAYAESAAGIVKSARELGFVGIGELHDGVQKFSYADRNFERLAENCGAQNLPICVHLTERGQRDYQGKVATDFDAAFNAAEKFGNVNFIFAHWLGSSIFEDAQAGENLCRLPNVFFDSAASPLLCGEDVWEKAVCKFPHKAVYGSDYPLRLYPRKFKTEEMATIADEARRNVPPRYADLFFAENINSALGDRPSQKQNA